MYTSITAHSIDRVFEGDPFRKGEELIDPGEMLQYQKRYPILAKDHADQSKGDPDRLIQRFLRKERQGNNGTKRLQDPGPECHA